MYFSSEVYNNKLVLHSELMIFIRYENNDYHFICYTQGNFIFHFIHAIFNEEFFPKYINFYINEHKLYNNYFTHIHFSYLKQFFFLLPFILSVRTTR